MTTISIKGLTKRYGDHLAVEDLNLEIESGEFLTLLGPSGCGKTTTLRMLAGFIRPDGGTITVDGKVISGPDGVVPPERRAMGMVFQSYALWPHKSVFDNIAYGLRMSRVDKKETALRVGEMLEKIGMRGMGDRYPHELSGGQQQRVALGRSLVLEPGTLLLDEPLSNLDAKLRDQMRLELQDIQARTGITFVYVTHDQSEAMTMSSRIAVLRAGKLVQVDRPSDLYFRPVDAGVADFMGSVNFLPGVVTDRRGHGTTIGIGGGGQIRAVQERYKAAEGERVMLGVRPEAIEVATPGSAGITGVIRRVVMMGGVSHLFVDVGGESDVRVQISSTSRMATGDEVVLVVDPEFVSLFPQTEFERPAARKGVTVELSAQRA